MAAAKPIVIFSAFLCLCIAGRTQQGFRFKLNSNDTLINSEEIITTGWKPVANINNFYRLHVGGAYRFASGSSEEIRHTVGLNYSISEKSFHPYYRASFSKIAGDWNLSVAAGYDQIRRVNFYGVGNESIRHPFNTRFNWLRTSNQYASVGLNRELGRHHRVGVNLLYDGIKVLQDVGRITGLQKGPVEAQHYKRQYFLGSQAAYSFTAVNNALLPTKGVQFSSSASYTENISRPGHSFARFTAELELYLPLPKHFSAFNRTGAATITGNPDFYQLNSLGGTNSLRGFQSFRFYGKTFFFNQTELRWIPSIETKFYKGPLGFFALLDQGRVWQPGESSAKMHYGYGGGVILTPLKNVAVTAAFAMSKEDRRFHFRVQRSF